jgi:hypothetical protein
MLQMATCAFDVHVQEILGALLVGSSIAMLHPQGNMDFDYVLSVVRDKQVSHMQSVPAYLNNMLDILTKQDSSKFHTLRTIDIGGKRYVVIL